MCVCVCGPTGEIHIQSCRHGQGYLHLPQGRAPHPLQRLHAGAGLSHCPPQRESPFGSLITAAARKSRLLPGRRCFVTYTPTFPNLIASPYSQETMCQNIFSA